MWFKNILILLLFSFLICDLSIAQQPPVKKDSTTLYKNIESFSKGSKFKTFIYRLVFRPVTADSKKKESKRRVYKKLIQKPYSNFEGKIIRNIEIVTLDPFGYTITDTAVARLNILTKAGNGMHIKTRGIAIRNLLLFHKNQQFSSILVKESERLIRVQKYVHDVSFSVVAAGVKTDSVDILIRVLDKWSIIPQGTVSPSGFRIGLTDKNFLGTGHEFQNIFSRNLTNGNNSFATNYSIPNIRNSYITTRLHYVFDTYRNFSRSLTIDRPFYSPVAKWAAGISFSGMAQNDSLKYVNYVYSSPYSKFNSQDFWAGKAIRIFKGSNDKERVTNLIITGRYLRKRYSEYPSEAYDPLHYFSNEDFYLTSIGVSSRKYVQDSYIFKFGVTEDVPVGKVFGITGGFQVKNNAVLPYLGMRFSFGNYNEWGYLSTNFEYGTLFNSSHAEEGAFIAGIDYFTGLIEIGKWKFRQFLKPQLTYGLNRSPFDSLTLNEGNGLSGFKSSALYGTKRLVFTMQTQSYPPWNFIGFRFGPFFSYSLGLLGDAESPFRKSKFYSQIGLGVLIKNENLVFKTFQISISFYPSIPGIGQDVFKMNSFRTTDFGFRDFEFGKPSVVRYR